MSWAALREQLEAWREGSASEADPKVLRVARALVARGEREGCVAPDYAVRDRDGGVRFERWGGRGITTVRVGLRVPYLCVESVFAADRAGVARDYPSVRAFRWPDRP